mmetsp:Transcript_21991/g.38736  ORF Transcript_21991/g.38736 Transcript_21991/m.38736 type:complete len:124 (-) Transcript_21991:46-417(-)
MQTGLRSLLSQQAYFLFMLGRSPKACSLSVLYNTKVDGCQMFHKTLNLEYRTSQMFFLCVLSINAGMPLLWKRVNKFINTHLHDLLPRNPLQLGLNGTLLIKFIILFRVMMVQLLWRVVIGGV